MAVRAFAYASTNDSIPGDSCGILVSNTISVNDETSHGPVWLHSFCNLDNLEFTLYDRWGEKIFTATKLDKNGYLPADLSTLKGQNGVYVYTLKFTRMVNGKEVKKSSSGHITVIQ